MLLWRGKKPGKDQEKEAQFYIYLQNRKQSLILTFAIWSNFPKEFIQHVDELSRGAVTGQAGGTQQCLHREDTCGNKPVEYHICKFIFAKKAMVVFPLKEDNFLHFIFLQNIIPLGMEYTDMLLNCPINFLMLHFIIKIGKESHAIHFLYSSPLLLTTFLLSGPTSPSHSGLCGLHSDSSLQCHNSDIKGVCFCLNCYVIPIL